MDYFINELLKQHQQRLASCFDLLIDFYCCLDIITTILINISLVNDSFGVLEIKTGRIGSHAFNFDTFDIKLLVFSVLAAVQAVATMIASIIQIKIDFYSLCLTACDTRFVWASNTALNIWFDVLWIIFGGTDFCAPKSDQIGAEFASISDGRIPTIMIDLGYV